MSTLIKTTSRTDIDQVIDQARNSERQRANLNLHETLEDPIQRLYIALEPNTYIRPHRHSEPGKWESLLLLEGHISLLTFDDQGQVLAREELRPGGTRTAQYPPGTWHSLVCHQSPSVIMEIKPGPFVPTSEHDFAPWAPAENTEGVGNMKAWLRRAATGDRVPEKL